MSLDPETETATTSFLGVEKSLTGRRWLSRPVDERLAATISQRMGVPELVGRVLASRDVSIDQANNFLNPTLRDSLPDPAHLKDMDIAAERLAGAIIQGERIAIFGDYDVDGATSSALLTRFLTAVGAQSVVYIPDRLTEGYGPNAPALLKLRQQGASVIVTVDCGTLAFDALEQAADAGLDVIVVDHHKAEPKLPRVVALVNPNRLDETSEHGQLAAVGVAFLVAVAVNRALREAGWYKTRTEPDLLSLLDLVALGTVCDVVPLTGVNRALVSQGLKVMARRANTGLTALSDVVGLDQPPGAYHAGFVLGPRINAGGRVGSSDLGSRLLSTNDPDEALRIAVKLNELNAERQEIEKSVLEDANRQAEEQVSSGGQVPVIVVAAPGWHPGVIGIVAGRLKERYNCPACVIALNDKGQGTGSGRSVRGVDLGSAVIAAHQAGLIIKGGGHAMAAGFTIEKNQSAPLREFLAERFSAFASEQSGVRGLYLDGGIKVSGVSAHMVRVLDQVGPFGSGNPEPRFAIPGARLVRAKPVGRDQSHVSCTLASEDGSRLNAIAFRCMDSDLGPALLRHDGAPFHFAGKLRLNSWQGRESAQLQIEDAAPVW